MMSVSQFLLAMQPEADQCSPWRQGQELHAFHSKVTRTYSISSNLSTNNALIPTRRQEGSTDPRSSPDGSSGAGDWPLPITGQQINDQEANPSRFTDSKTNASGYESRSQPPEEAGFPIGWTSSRISGASQPCPDDVTLQLPAMDGSKLPGETRGPVASDSRGELLQCDGASTLEDVLRHYWLLSDHDEEKQKIALRREPVYRQAYDWLYGKSNGDTASFLDARSVELNGEAQDVLMQFERDDEDDDADSIVTLSTISEEDSEEISSPAESSRQVGSLFGNTDSTFRITNDPLRNPSDPERPENLRDNGIADIFVGDLPEDDNPVQNLNDETSSDTSETSGKRIPDGLDSEEDEPVPSSNAVGSLVHTLSQYISDVYPFSASLIPHHSREEEVMNPSTVLEPVFDQNPRETYGEYTVSDTRVHLKFVPCREIRTPDHLPVSPSLEERSKSVLSGDWRENRFSTADSGGRTSTIASPTSWYTVSDVFDSQSFETASEKLEEDTMEVSMATAYARCTATAKCPASDGVDAGVNDLIIPGSWSSVTTKVTAWDPVAALSRAAARAASLAAATVIKACREGDQPAGNIEVTVTANCEMTSNRVDFDRAWNDVQAGYSSKSGTTNDGELNRFEDTAVKDGDTLLKLESSSPISMQTFVSTSKYEDFDGEETPERVMSAIDSTADGKISCQIAIPCTKDGDGSSLTKSVLRSTGEGTTECEVTGVAVKERVKIKDWNQQNSVMQNSEKVRGISTVNEERNSLGQTITSNFAHKMEIVSPTDKGSSRSDKGMTIDSDTCQIVDTPDGSATSTAKVKDPIKIQGENREIQGGDQRSSTDDPGNQVLRSQSLLLETDIDTLQQRQTIVSSNNSNRLSTPGSRSHASLLSPKTLNRNSTGFHCWDGSFSFSKEVLEAMLSDSPPVRYLAKKKPSWDPNSPPAGHYASEPNLQPEASRKTVCSEDRDSGQGRTGSEIVEQSKDALLPNEDHHCGSQRQSMERLKSQPDDEKVSKIERYDESPSLRRRSLSILSTVSFERQRETGVTTKPLDDLGGPPVCSNDRVLRSHSLRPVSSSFENLVDSLLGITAVMSMETAITHSRSSSVGKRSGSLRKLDPNNSSQISIERRNFDSQTKNETTGTQGGTGDPALTALSASPGSTPLHPGPAVRKHVHFRKAKHIFRKCSFCIEGNGKKRAASPTKSRETTTALKKNANGTAKR